MLVLLRTTTRSPSCACSTCSTLAASFGEFLLRAFFPIDMPVSTLFHRWRSQISRLLHNGVSVERSESLNAARGAGCGTAPEADAEGSSGALDESEGLVRHGGVVLRQERRDGGENKEHAGPLPLQHKPSARSKAKGEESTRPPRARAT